MFKLSKALLLGLSTLASSAKVSKTCGCQQAYALGNGFAIFRTDCDDRLTVTKDNIAIWSTNPTETFLSASSGEDLYVSESGNFNITNVDNGRCRDQDVTDMDFVPWDGAEHGHSVAIKGKLLECGAYSDTSTEYTANFWVPSEYKDRVAFRFEVAQPDVASAALNKIYITFASNIDEDFYGLGAQASFGSLKNHSLPIFAREQGFGRGDSTTELQNLANYFAGGDQYTAYTAIPHYVSTDRKAFYLSQNSTAPAEFDFTAPDAITVRYSNLSVEGHFLQAANMLDAISKSTEYTGRMIPLPNWVDEGAVIGIQGGEDKVNNVIQDGVDADCPIAAVWLQDW